jgi:ATP-dependent RNA helicase SUPV3L1/SUV3
MSNINPNNSGVACNLVTGQELLEVPGANHVSCTVEMANLSQPYEVAVIDEAQLIGDDKCEFPSSPSSPVP